MIGTAITSYQFTIEKAITEWLEQKRIRTGSQKTYDAYRDTMQSFRLVLWQGNIDLLDNPTDIQRLATIWANTRNSQSRRPNEDVSPSTYNQRLAILSSFYTFLCRRSITWISLTRLRASRNGLYKHMRLGITH